MRRGHGSPPVLSEVPHELSTPMRTPKSANGPRSNSFRPDSPSPRPTSPGRKTQPSPLTTPDMVRSGRVLPTSVKSPFKVVDNHRPERTMSSVRKPPPESSVPGENLPRGSRRNQLRRGHGSPPVLSEVSHELSIPMRTPKSANGPRSNSFRPDFPSATNLPTGTEDSASSPHHTGHGPFRTRPPNLS